jgi:hypothetical protein
MHLCSECDNECECPMDESAGYHLCEYCEADEANEEFLAKFAEVGDAIFDEELV